MDQRKLKVKREEKKKQRDMWSVITRVTCSLCHLRLVNGTGRTGTVSVHPVSVAYGTGRDSLNRYTERDGTVISYRCTGTGSSRFIPVPVRSVPVPVRFI